jgi:hypothetical protein
MNDLTAETFNALYPVGTPVVVYPGARPEDVADCRRIETATRTAAWNPHGTGDPVVMVEGYGSWIALTHVDLIEEPQGCGESGCLCYGTGEEHGDCACGCDCPRYTNEAGASVLAGTE